MNAFLFRYDKHPPRRKTQENFFFYITYLPSVILPAGITRTMFGTAIEIDSK